VYFVCVCVCVRTDSVIYNKSVSLLGHQHTLFQYKALLTYYLSQMSNIRIYMDYKHPFQDVKDNLHRDIASISTQEHQETGYFI
jgi:hypothetical protein